MKNILVSNNPAVLRKFSNSFIIVDLVGRDYIEVLKYVRDRVHAGHELLTHPLSGSIKPNETPYKSIIISSNKGAIDNQGVMIIEESIATAQKFLDNKKTPNWTQRVLEDFSVIDLSLMENVIERLGHK